MEQFYITLPSNSSMGYYPNNTVTNFITHLSRTIALQGKWEVAVVEAHYPCSFQARQENNPIRVNAFVEKPYDPSKAMTGTLTGEGEMKTPKVVEAYTVTGPTLSGDYNEVEEIIDSFNEHNELSEHVSFEYDANTKKVEIIPKSHVTKVELAQTLALQLGFNPSANNLKKKTRSVRAANLKLGLPSYIYIYCDIVEPQLIGDTSAPLLQILNIDTAEYVYGTNKHVQFHSPHYVTVMKNNFESIEIDLRDDTGEHIPFQFGTSCVKLHFRKCLQ